MCGSTKRLDVKNTRIRMMLLTITIRKNSDRDQNIRERPNLTSLENAYWEKWPQMVRDLIGLEVPPWVCN